MTVSVRFEKSFLHFEENHLVIIISTGLQEELLSGDQFFSPSILLFGFLQMFFKFCSLLFSSLDQRERRLQTFLQSWQLRAQQVLAVQQVLRAQLRHTKQFDQRRVSRSSTVWAPLALHGTERYGRNEILKHINIHVSLNTFHVKRGEPSPVYGLSSWAEAEGLKQVCWIPGRCAGQSTVGLTRGELTQHSERFEIERWMDVEIPKQRLSGERKHNIFSLALTIKSVYLNNHETLKTWVLVSENSALPSRNSLHFKIC